MAGLPGSGKSYLGKRIAQKLKMPYLSSDLLRRKIFPNPAYTSEEKAEVYEFMLRLMKRYLRDEGGVVLDATFYLKAFRKQFIESAREFGAVPYIIYIAAQEATIRKRMGKKRLESDANFQVYQKLKEIYQPIEEPHLQLSSDENHVDALLKQVFNYILPKNE
jgi:predicted kinase